MFIIHQKYERPELLDFIGSKQAQSGILWNKNGGDSIIITTGGRHTKRVGYSDSELSNGNWEYTGQGESGDQDPYNFANSLIRGGQKKILLFSTLEPNAKEVRERGHHGKLYEYRGLFEIKSWKLVEQKEGKRKGDKLIKNILKPLVTEIPNYTVKQESIEGTVNEPIGLNKYRKQIIKSNKKASLQKKTALTEYILRSSQIKKYALLRAKGKCEYCNKKAPFKTLKNVPFLEVHHIFSLADDGPDHPLNVAAICPNCHREAHYGKNQELLKKKLEEIIKVKESSI